MRSLAAWSPGQVIATAFAAAILVGWGALALPAASADGRSHPLAALFTATSAVSVTGLAVVDTATAWSTFGLVTIVVLVQLGGLGITTAATLVALVISRRLGSRARLLALAEARSLSSTDVRSVVRTIAVFTVAIEAAVAIALLLKWTIVDGQAPLQAAGSAGFHAVMAVNNAGFSVYSDSLTRYASDPYTLLIISGAVIVGSLGFPVVFELARNWRRPGSWSVLTLITVWVTVPLLVIGTIILAAVEWTNPRTLGSLSSADSVLGAFFHGVMARSAGFNAFDTAGMTDAGLLATDALMFVGGGSASTAGGIKVTTFGLLALVLWAELRGNADVEAGRRRVPVSTQRQAVAVALLSVGLVAVGSFALHLTSGLRTDQVLFETISAFATVGLSAGATAELPPAAQVIVVVLMYIGRVGPVTLASALALRQRAKLYQLPEERMIVG